MTRDASWVRDCLARGDLDGALTYASLAAGLDPLSGEPQALLGLIHSRMGQHDKAAASLDRAVRLGVMAVMSPEEQGFLFSAAAVTYAFLGRIDDALTALDCVPREVRLADVVRSTFVPAFKRVQEAAALRALKVLWELLVWNDEPLKARQLLCCCAPAVIEEFPRVAELRALTEQKLNFIRSWAAYCECYNHLDPHAYDCHRDDAAEVRSSGRMAKVREWAAAVPITGDVIRVLAIGPQDCILERDLLTMNPRFHVTVSDVSDLAKGSVASLREEFPGRVSQWRVTSDYHDWPDGAFDAIVCLEVIEHLPYQEEALQQMRKRLTRSGVLLLSTPCAGAWTNPRLTRDPESHEQWGHLHANSPESLRRLLEARFLRGVVEIIDDGFFLFVRASRDDNDTP